MIEREITPVLVGLFRQYPFVTVTGPRQSGKTTLCRAAFPGLKHRFNTGRRSNLSFFRDADGLECDLLYENGNGIGVIETKAGTRIRTSHLAALDRVANLLPRVCAKAVIHGGTDRRPWGDCEVVPFLDLPRLLARLDASPPLSAGGG